MRLMRSPRRRAERMGFQAADIVEFGRSLLRMPGVTNVWHLPALEGSETTLGVLVRGFDQEAFERRLAVREAIEEFIQTHGSDMRDSGFTFVYEVAVDDDDLGAVQ